MIWLVKCLSCKYQDKSLDQQHPHNSWTWQSTSRLPVLWGRDRQTSLDLTGQLVQLNQLAPGRLKDPTSKDKVGSNLGRLLTLTSDLHTHTHTCAHKCSCAPHMQTCIHPQTYTHIHHIFLFAFGRCDRHHNQKRLGEERGLFD